MVDSPEWPGLSVAGGCRIGLSTPDAGWQCWVERKDPPTGDTFPDAASSAVSFLSNEDILPNDVHSARCPEALLGPSKAAFHLNGSQHVLVPESLLPKSRTFHFSSLNFMGFLSTYIPSLLRLVWLTAWPSDELITPSQFCVIGSALFGQIFLTCQWQLNMPKLQCL